jgi:hypothetical protein
MLATYRGVPYEAGVGPSGADVVLFAACPPPEELGFEPATGHWRKRVIRAEIDALWESRPVGFFRGEPCIVLDDLGDRLHIAYLGTDYDRAAWLGYWQIDHGVFELLTPREDVTGLTEERVDKPLRLAPPVAGPSQGPRPGYLYQSLPALAPPEPPPGPPESLPGLPEPVRGWPESLPGPPEPVRGLPESLSGPGLPDPRPEAPRPVTELPGRRPAGGGGPAPGMPGPLPSLLEPLPGVPGPDLDLPALPPDLGPTAPPPDLGPAAPPPDLGFSAAPPDLGPAAAPPPDLGLPALPPDLGLSAAPPDLNISVPPPALPEAGPPPGGPPLPGQPACQPGPGGGNGGRSARRQRVTIRDVFCELADRAAIPRTAYALGAEVDGALCLMPTGAGYQVFVPVDGTRHEVRLFPDEEAAYFYLFGVLAAQAIQGGTLAPAALRNVPI